jgi:outer membrane murein-binding lipoprotein Lpp
MARRKQAPHQIEVDMTAAGETANRIRAVMGWPLDVVGSTGFLFKAWRAVGTGEALAISLEKVNEIAEEIERLKSQIAVMEADRRVG